jgi:hypothetical protein
MPSKHASLTTQEAPQGEKRYFTLASANRAVTYVARVVEDVAEAYSQIVELRRRIEHAGPDQFSPRLEADYDSAMDRLGSCIDELHAVGVELKDFEQGLVDFPALHQEREIHLCWKRGEKKITYWHELEAGFAGRQSVDLLDQTEKVK